MLVLTVRNTVADQWGAFATVGPSGALGFTELECDGLEPLFVYCTYNIYDTVFMEYKYLYKGIGELNWIVHAENDIE